VGLYWLELRAVRVWSMVMDGVLDREMEMGMGMSFFVPFVYYTFNAVRVVMVAIMGDAKGAKKKNGNL